jgi:hypothetical protein
MIKQIASPETVEPWSGWRKLAFQQLETQRVMRWIAFSLLKQSKHLHQHFCISGP